MEVNREELIEFLKRLRERDGADGVRLKQMIIDLQYGAKVSEPIAAGLQKSN